MSNQIELPGSIPSYDVTELVVFHPEDVRREIVCEVVGYQSTSSELLYRLRGVLDDEDYLASFRNLAPHIEDGELDPWTEAFENDCIESSDVVDMQELFSL